MWQFFGTVGGQQRWSAICGCGHDNLLATTAAILLAGATAAALSSAATAVPYLDHLALRRDRGCAGCPELVEEAAGGHAAGMLLQQLCPMVGRYYAGIGGLWCGVVSDGRSIGKSATRVFMVVVLVGVVVVEVVSGFK